MAPPKKKYISPAVSQPTFFGRQPKVFSGSRLASGARDIVARIAAGAVIDGLEGFVEAFANIDILVENSIRKGRSALVYMI